MASFNERDFLKAFYSDLVRRQRIGMQSFGETQKGCYGQ